MVTDTKVVLKNLLNTFCFRCKFALVTEDNYFYAIKKYRISYFIKIKFYLSVYVRDNQKYLYLLTMPHLNNNNTGKCKW